MDAATALAALVLAAYAACGVSAFGLALMVGGPRRAAPVASFFFATVPNLLLGHLGLLAGRAVRQTFGAAKRVAHFVTMTCIDPPLRVLIRALDFILAAGQR